jgi:hypothetical protein
MSSRRLSTKHSLLSGTRRNLIQEIVKVVVRKRITLEERRKKQLYRQAEVVVGAVKVVVVAIIKRQVSIALKIFRHLVVVRKIMHLLTVS